MLIFEDKAALRLACEEARREGKRVGLVPTMGALHAGHLSLVETARDQGAEFLVLTIFVNPLQFAEGEDLDDYPRPREEDLAACREAGVDAVFAPVSKNEMYPAGYSTRVIVEGVTAPLEGAFRPTHFEGVTTIVTKLLNLAAPCVAVFGKKDYQQWRTIERLAADLEIPAEVVGAPIVREADGLALSSRNRYLSEEEREKAVTLSRALQRAKARFEAGERDTASLEAAALEQLRGTFDSVDYVRIVGASHFYAPKAGDEAVILAAATLGKTRLIDNLELGVL